jgi:hypothetical protein
MGPTFLYGLPEGSAALVYPSGWYIATPAGRESSTYAAAGKAAPLFFSFTV